MGSLADWTQLEKGSKYLEDRSVEIVQLTHTSVQTCAQILKKKNPRIEEQYM